VAITTIKLDISEIDDADFVSQKQKGWSYAFRKLYVNSHLLNDKEFLKKLRTKFSLDAYELNCLIIDVKSKLAKTLTKKSKTEDQIIEAENILKETNLRPNLRYKLNNKLVRLNKSLSKEITFGGLVNLQKISYLSNDKLKNKDELKTIRNIYNDSRILPISYYGSKHNKNSNRYFKFDFINNTIVYKANKQRIVIKYKCCKNYQKLLLQLSEIQNSKLLPISVKLSKDHIAITYDNSVLNGYAFNSKEYKKEVKGCTAEDKKTVGVKWFKEQESRKLMNKNEKRYLCVDLNPEFVGISILDRTGDVVNDTFDVVHTATFDTTELNIKLNLDSTDPKQIYQNNKMKYEVGVMWKKIFNIAKHFNVSYIVLEDLNFKPKVVNQESREFNRKCRNIWNLGYQQNLIDKHIDENGFVKVEVNPCYTSFIGNIKYNYHDPVNASVEIGRRGMYQYNKGFKLIPIVTEDNVRTMEALFSDSGLDVAQLEGCKSWANYHFRFKQTKCKYRFGLDDVKSKRSFSMSNVKSMVRVHTFT
jgi:IS605 OrfB family transposase